MLQFAVLRSWWWANVCPKHVELILKINKYCCLLHLVGLDFITLPTLKMHGQTQIKKCSYTVYYCVSLCIIMMQLSKKELTVKYWNFLNRKLLLRNMHRAIMTTTKTDTVIKIFDDYNGDYNKYIELCWIWFLLWSKLQHYSVGGDDTDGINTTLITLMVIITQWGL
jgi:hypothetical protein